MSDYKVIKEAFHADNPGGPVLEVLGVSFICATSYLFYAAFASTASRRPSLFAEYALAVLPLLLAVTLFANWPFTWHLFLIVCSLVVALQRPARLTQQSESVRRQLKKGQWLEESDSDEEPAQPAGAAPYNQQQPTMGVLLPSQIIGRSTSIITNGLNHERTSTSSPDTLSPEDPSTDALARQRSYRRHSPTPSTHTHMAIDILTTPELREATSLKSDVAYPASRSTQHSEVIESRQPSTENTRKDGRHSFLAVYRAHMMIMTIHCILAVDFPVFPRALGKCETFGTSVMDIGVGSFVFSLGIVSFKSMTRGGRRGVNAEIWSSLRKAAPVIVLGLVRVLMVKGTEYPEHVSEYGVHWNFFITLGVVPVLAILMKRFKRRWMRWSVVGLSLSLLHQWILAVCGLQTWVLSDARDGWLGMNKEGLVSLPGYLAIFILGLSAGQHILRSSLSTASVSSVTESGSTRISHHREKRRAELVLELFSYSVAYWILFALSTFLAPVSRRLANLPYILFIAGFNTTGLLCYLAIERYFVPDQPDLAVPQLLDAVNKNGLAVFLLANLATGAINLSMKTMYASTPVSMLVLIVYSTSVCGVAWVGRGVRLKL